MRTSKPNRLPNEINAGSMADIAFLLLIFFLVTTTIINEKGIRVTLPPWDNSTANIQHPENEVLSVKINAENRLLVEGEKMNIDLLKNKTKEFIMNKGRNPKYSSSPKSAVVSIQNDRSTNYETYLSVYNELKAAYNELWNEAAKTKHQIEYASLSKSEQKLIRKDIPLIISEAEATDHN